MQQNLCYGRTDRQTDGQTHKGKKYTPSLLRNRGIKGLTLHSDIDNTTIFSKPYYATEN